MKLHWILLIAVTIAALLSFEYRFGVLERAGDGVETAVFHLCEYCRTQFGDDSLFAYDFMVFALLGKQIIGGIMQGAVKG